jgi:hypothetical protein
MKRYALSIAFCVMSASAAFAQTKSPVEGVWKIVELVMPGRNPSEKGVTVTDPQPGLMIFTKGYYSQVIVMSEQPRAAVEIPKEPRTLPRPRRSPGMRSGGRLGQLQEPMRSRERRSSGAQWWQRTSRS